MLSRIRQWLNVETWDKAHVSMPPIEEWHRDPEWCMAASSADRAWLLERDDEHGLTSKEEIKEYEKQYDLPWDIMKDYVPIPPQSALKMPVKLHPEEKAVAQLDYYLRIFFVDAPPLKSSLAGKIKASRQPPIRVYRDASGKLKPVKAKKGAA